MSSDETPLPKNPDATVGRNGNGDIHIPAPPSLLSLLTNRNFSSIFLGGLISEIGSFFTFIAMMFLALDITSDLPLAQSAQAVALITLFFILPSLFIGPFTGAFVDRYDRKKIMYIADLCGSLVSFGLVYVAVFTQELAHIYAFAFLSTMVRLFFYPARGASIPVVVEKPEALVKANGIVQIFSQLSRAIGPALAGIIIARFSLELAFVIDGISFLISALLIFTIRTDLKPKTEGDTTIGKIFSDLIVGAKLVKNDRVLWFVMGFFMVIIFGIGMIDPLFAIYLSRNFGFGEEQFGYILSLSAISGLVSAMILTAKGQISRKIAFTISTTFIAGSSLALIAFAEFLPYNPLIWLYLGMAIIGSVNVMFIVPFSALIQAIVKNEHLGKINGFLSTGLALSQVGGAAVASYLATFAPIYVIYASVGVALLVSGVFGLLLLKSLGLEQEAQEREAAAIAESNASKSSEQLSAPVMQEQVTDLPSSTAISD